MKSYKLIGLTGTTGSGKGQVCSIFSQMGYTVIDADLLARKAVEDPLVLKLLSTHFGEDIIKNNKLDRKLLGQRAFSSKAKTAVLNSITHPFISALFIEELEKLTANGVKRIVFDAPQLFESKLNVLCDSIVSVVADKEIRINRIMTRDELSKDEAEKRISIQHTDEFFVKNSDYIITNNSTLENLTKQTTEIISKL